MDTKVKRNEPLNKCEPHNEALELLARRLIGLSGIRDIIKVAGTTDNLFFVSISNTIRILDKHGTADDEGYVIGLNGEQEDEGYSMIAVFEDKEEAMDFAYEYYLADQPGYASFIMIESLDGTIFERGLSRQVKPVTEEWSHKY